MAGLVVADLLVIAVPGLLLMSQATTEVPAATVVLFSCWLAFLGSARGWAAVALSGLLWACLQRRALPAPVHPRYRGRYARRQRG